MKITPIEIRQHTFEKGLRGYKSEDVDAFLGSLSQEWERVTSDYKMLKMQLELAEKDLNKLKEVEMTLFRTLKTAEDTSTQITEQANRAGEKYIADAQQKADEILADARKRSALMVQDAENKARYLKDNILNDLKSLEHDFKALESYKENLAVQIRTLASNAVDSVDRFEKKFTRQNLKGKIDETTEQLNAELKERNSLKMPDIEPVEAIPPVHISDPVADLPPLIERETAIPEAILANDALLAKLNDALERSAQSMSGSETAYATDFSSPAPTTSSVSTPTEEQAPTEVVESYPEKKGGSFFDQI